MTTETQDPAPVAPVTDPVADAKFVEDLMREYSTPAVNKEPDPVAAPNPPTPDPVTSQPTPTPTPPPTSGDPSAPYGRYLTGKKAGQPKPPPRQYKYNTPPPPPGTTPPPASVSGMLIDGGLFLMLIDIALPLGICALSNNFTDGPKIKPEKLQLTEAQKRQLTPVVEKVMASIQLTGNPMAVLFIGLITIYGMNFMNAKLEAK